MADKPTANFDNHENDQIKAGHNEGEAAAARMSVEAAKLAANDSRSRTNDRAVEVAVQGDVTTAEKFPPKIEAAAYKSYASAVASMPKEGIGSVSETKDVVDYFKAKYPQNLAFMSGVERAVLT